MTDATPLTAAQLKVAKAKGDKKSPDKRSPDKKKRVRGAAQRDWFGAAMSLELVQEGGDVLFVPAGWAHSTLNVEVSVGVVHDNWRVPLIDSCEADKMTRV